MPTRFPARRFAFVILAAPLALVAADPPPKDRVHPDRLVELADEHHGAGRLAEASRLYRKALFVSPGHKKASAGWRRIRKDEAERLAASAAAAWATDERAAAEALRRAAQLDPGNPTVKKLGREHGFEEHRGEWRSKAEIAAEKARRGEVETARKKSISVGPDFQVLYEGPFRFFTDVDTRLARSTLEQMTASIATHWAKYREVMAPFDLAVASDLDVVLFAKREDYLRSAGIPGTGGVYYPGRGVAYFFGEGGWNFSTMLHEMTHQLNDKLLRARAEAWFEEGIAEYFGAGFLTHAGKRIELGRVDAGRLQAFQGAVRGHEGRVIPLADFVRMPQAELTGEFYAQAWALLHYLMEVHPCGRSILFDYIEGHRSPGGRHLEEVLADYAMDLASFELQFLTHFRTGGGPG